jgi:hypothetical protein
MNPVRPLRKKICAISLIFQSLTGGNLAWQEGGLTG